MKNRKKKVHIDFAASLLQEILDFIKVLVNDDE